MIWIGMIFGKNSGNLNIETLKTYGKPQFAYSVVVYKYSKPINWENHNFSSALTETDSSSSDGTDMPSDIIWTPYDGNSEERYTQSDLRNAAYAITITAVVRGSLSIPD